LVVRCDSAAGTLTFSVPPATHARLDPANHTPAEILTALGHDFIFGDSLAGRNLVDTEFPAHEYGRILLLNDVDYADFVPRDTDWVIFPDESCIRSSSYWLVNTLFAIFRTGAGWTPNSVHYPSRACLQAYRLVVVLDSHDIRTVDLDNGVTLTSGIEVVAYPFVLHCWHYIAVFGWTLPPIPKNFKFHDWVYGLDAMAKTLFARQALDSATSAYGFFVPSFAHNLARDGRDNLISWRVGHNKTNWMVTRGYLGLSDSTLGVNFGIESGQLVSAWVTYGMACGFMIDKLMQLLGGMWFCDANGVWDDWSFNMWRSIRAARMFVPYAGSAPGEYMHSAAYYPRELSRDLGFCQGARSPFFRGFTGRFMMGMADAIAAEVRDLEKIRPQEYFSFSRRSTEKVKDLFKAHPNTMRYVVRQWFENGVAVAFNYANVDDNAGYPDTASETVVMPFMRDGLRVTFVHGESEGEVVLGTDDGVPCVSDMRSAASEDPFKDF